MKGSVVLLLIAALAQPAVAQVEDQKVFWLGAARTLGGDTTGMAITFAFNQPDEAKSPGAPVFATFSCFGAGNTCTVTPSVQVSLGNGTKTAANNILAQIALARRWGGVAGAPWKRITFTPINMSADRDLSTVLGYTSLGLDLILDRWDWALEPRESGKHRAVRWAGRVGLAGDLGRRFQPGPDEKGLFARLRPTAALTLQYGYYLQLVSTGKLFLHQDVPGESRTDEFGVLTTSVDLRFRQGSFQGEETRLFPLGLTLKYVLGRDEPIFQRVHSISLGASIFIVPFH